VSWTALHITPSANRDAVISALFDAGSQGIHEDGNTIVTHFPPDTDIDAVRSAVLSADADATVSVSETPPVSWDEWRARVSAHQLGRLVVTPPWLADQYDPNTTIVIDPAMAFGTGEHPTTRGVMRLMQRVVRPGDSVADLGAGSAVLAIASAKLGATQVAAIELDPDASSNAQANIEQNNVADRVQYIEGDAEVLLPLVAPVNIIFANIISSVLIELLPSIKSALAPNGKAILSGIMLEERPMMLGEIEKGNWIVEAEDTEEQWWSVLISQPA
jgi:ribosomal protein L11 methyltransferase